MQLTRQADYAIRAVLFLSTSPLVNIQEIAKAQFVPQEYLAKILQKLSKSGLITTHRGVGGGISLAKPPEQITLLDVIGAVEGPLAINRCLSPENDCARQDFCVVHDELDEIQKFIENRLSKLNFAALARKEAARRRKTASALSSS